MDIFERLLNYANAWLRLTKSQIKLFVLEFKLAKASVVPFLIVLFFLSILIISTWFSLLTFIGYEIYIHSQSMFWALLSVLIINIASLIIIAIFVFIYLKQISFARTRSKLQSYKKMELQDENQ